MNDAARQIQDEYRQLAYDLLYVLGRAAAEYADAHPELELSHQGTFNPPLGPVIDNRPASLTVHRELANGSHWVVVAGFGMRTTVTPVYPGRLEQSIDWRAAGESGTPPLKIPISAQWTATDRFGMPLVRDIVLSSMIVEGSTIRWNDKRWTGVAAVDAPLIIEGIFEQTVLLDSPDAASIGSRSRSQLIDEKAEHVLHVVWNEFQETAHWAPRTVVLTRTRKHGQLDKLCRAIGERLLDCQSANSSGPVCRIHLSALVLLRGRLRTPLRNAERDSANVVEAIRYFARRVIADPRAQHEISAEDLQATLGMTELEAHRVALLLVATEDIHAGGYSFNVADAWPRFRVSPEVVAFEDIRTLDDYFALLDERRARQPNKRRRGNVEVDVRPPEDIYEANRNSILSAIGIAHEQLQKAPRADGARAVRPTARARKPQLVFETATDRYTAMAILGQGGSGVVYRAVDGSGEPVAVKLLRPSTATTEKLKRFKNELRFSQRRQHPHIVEFLDYGRALVNGANAPFYIMPLYDGSLRTLIDGKLDSGRILRYFSHVLDGVEFAHTSGVIHRDLKPENVFVHLATDTLVVGDFGAAHFAEDLLATIVETAPDTRTGNFQYAAPEQRTRGAAVDLRADLYALGLMLNEMFTGKVPHGTSYPLIGSASPAHACLDEVVHRLLRNAREERYASVTELREALHL